MPVSPAQAAKRALVKVLLRIARLYQVVLQLTRDSTDEVVKSSFKKVMLKAHPDKNGGRRDHAQELLKAMRHTSRSRALLLGVPPPRDAVDIVKKYEERRPRKRSGLCARRALPGAPVMLPVESMITQCTRPFARRPLACTSFGKAWLKLDESRIHTG